jgi:hypothetical protein
MQFSVEFKARLNNKLDRLEVCAGPAAYPTRTRISCAGLCLCVHFDGYLVVGNMRFRADGQQSLQYQGINMVAGPITAARPDVKVHLDDPDMAVVANVFKVRRMQVRHSGNSFTNLLVYVSMEMPFWVRRLFRWEVTSFLCMTRVLCSNIRAARCSFAAADVPGGRARLPQTPAVQPARAGETEA